MENNDPSVRLNCKKANDRKYSRGIPLNTIDNIKQSQVSQQCCLQPKENKREAGG